MHVQLPVVGLTIACGPGSTAHLGRVDVQPSCAATDRVCLNEGFDAPIAVGATQSVEFEFWVPGSAPPPVVLEAVDADVFSISGRTLTAHAAGTAALLISDPDAHVIDFIHLWTAAPDSLHLVRRTTTGAEDGELRGTVQLRAGTQLEFRTEARLDESPLLGVFPTDFTTDGDIVAVLSTGVDGAFAVEALAPGETTVVASALGLEASVVVEVL